MKDECGSGGLNDADGIEPRTIVEIGNLRDADGDVLVAFSRRLGLEVVRAADGSARAIDDDQPRLRVVERVPTADDRSQLARHPSLFVLFIVEKRFTFPPGLEPELTPSRFDYIRRPFDAPELLWRARSALNQLSLLHRRGPAERPSVLRYGPILYDPSRREARVRDVRLDLRPAERELLAYLISNSNRCVNATEIVRQVLHSSGDGAAARNQIYELRRKLRAAGLPDAIRTEGRNGYRILLSANGSRADDAGSGAGSGAPRAR